MRVKDKSEKSGLKLNIQKTKIMASDPITSWLSQNKLINWHSYLSISVCQLGYIKSACLTKLSKLNSLIFYIKDHTKVLPF